MSRCYPRCVAHSPASRVAAIALMVIAGLVLPLSAGGLGVATADGGCTASSCYALDAGSHDPTPVPDDPCESGTSCTVHMLSGHSGHLHALSAPGIEPAGATTSLRWRAGLNVVAADRLLSGGIDRPPRFAA